MGIYSTTFAHVFSLPVHLLGLSVYLFLSLFQFISYGRPQAVSFFMYLERVEEIGEVGCHLGASCASRLNFLIQ